MSNPNKPSEPKVPGELAAALRTAREIGQVGVEHITGPPLGEPTDAAAWDADTDRAVLADVPLPKPEGPKIVTSTPHPQRFVQPRTPQAP